MSTMTEMTADQWLETYGVTFDWSADGFHADADGWEHRRYTLTLTGPGGPASWSPQQLDIPWRQGLGVDEDPTPESTLWAIAQDVRYGEMTWEEFADEFGYDALEAPLSQYRTWEACDALRAEVYRFMGTGEMLEDFLNIPESDS